MITEISDHARKVVANGVKLLDEKVPGWWKVIDLQQLKMSDCTQCMLGQLFGHETEKALGAKMFGLPLDESLVGMQYVAMYHLGKKDLAGYQRGLAALGIGPNGYVIGCNIAGEMDYVELKCAWAEVIAERRTADEPVDEPKG